MHDDCHNVYRPVNWSDVFALQVNFGSEGSLSEPGQHTERRLCSLTSQGAGLNKRVSFLKAKTLCIELKGLQV